MNTLIHAIPTIKKHFCTPYLLKNHFPVSHQKVLCILFTVGPDEEWQPPDVMGRSLPHG